MSNQTQWTSDDVPFAAIGEGKDKEGRSRVKKLLGRYLYATTMNIKKRATIVHRIELHEADVEIKDRDGNVAERGQEINVFGSGAVNARLRRLPEGTLVKLTYLGEKDVGQDSPMKDIKVEWPKGTKLLPPPKVKRVIEREAGEDDGDDDVAF